MAIKRFFKLLLPFSIVALIFNSCERIREVSPTATETSGNQLLKNTSLIHPDIIVNTTSDVADFAGAQQVGDLPGPDGLVSLREAIIAANNTSGPNLIGFNIPTTDLGFDGNVFVIYPQSNLPELSSGGTKIDGATQTQFSGNTNTTGPEIVIDCNSISGSRGFGITSANNCINSLVINRYTNQGIIIYGGSAIQNVITGCFLGLNASGADAPPHVVNYVEGILIEASHNQIGGMTSKERNVVSGNDLGIDIRGQQNTVFGNYIGTDVAGTKVVGNTFDGINFSGSYNRIGGVSQGAGNLISGNNDGIFGPGNTNSIEGNIIGLDATGSKPIGNREIGIWVLPPGENNKIRANVASGNVQGGIRYDGYNGLIAHNLVGTDTKGNPGLGNGQMGIWVYKAGQEDHGQIVISENIVASNGDLGIIVEGKILVSRNRVFQNHSDGVRASGVLEGPSFTHVCITQNQIYQNGSLGIDIDTPYGGVNPNDPGDLDEGANRGMNYPVLESAKATNGNLVVKGYIDTQNPRLVTLEFFANPVPIPGGDPSGYGEGAIYLGSDRPNVQGKFTSTLPRVAPGTIISATATDADGNTSEFSADIIALAPGK